MTILIKMKDGRESGYKEVSQFYRFGVHFVVSGVTIDKEHKESFQIDRYLMLDIAEVVIKFD